MNLVLGLYTALGVCPSTWIPLCPDNPRSKITPKALQPFALEPLALGSVKPHGWLRDQLRLMADGLPGHEHEFYPYVRDNPWVGGHDDYSSAHEALPYWFNGVVPLAYLLDDERLQQHVRSTADYVLRNQQSDGWLGPETNTSDRDFWGRYPMLLGLTQLAEVEQATSLEVRILDAMHRFVDLAHLMLTRDDDLGFIQSHGQWGRARAADIILTLQWLYERDPRNQSSLLLECMALFHSKALNWTSWYTNEIYPKEDPSTLPNNFSVVNKPYLHGVNVAEAFKFGAVIRRFRPDDDGVFAETSRRAVHWTMKYRGSPSGAIIADETAAGLSPVRGVELCNVVETMFSLSYLYQALGENHFADRCELAAYNALPVMTLPDWWAHQYVAQTNQPISHRLDKSPFSGVTELGQTYGLEPNYPCCTVNHPQGYPKYVAASYLREGENGIAHVLLGPTSVRTSTRAGVFVEIICDTAYPFAQALSYTIRSSDSFDFLIRVPDWVQSAQFLVNGLELQHVHPDPVTGLQRVRVHGDDAPTVIHVQFTTDIRIEPRANDTIAIYHGALLYALSIPYNITSYAVPGYPDEELPIHVRNHDLFPTGQWAYAIDPSTLQYKACSENQTSLPSPLWAFGDADTSPTVISASVCRIYWPLRDGYSTDPPRGGNRTCLGPPITVDLVPYGGAKLHMAEIPIMTAD